MYVGILLLCVWWVLFWVLYLLNLSENSFNGLRTYSNLLVLGVSWIFSCQISLWIPWHNKLQMLAYSGPYSDGTETSVTDQWFLPLHLSPWPSTPTAAAFKCMLETGASLAEKWELLAGIPWACPPALSPLFLWYSILNSRELNTWTWTSDGWA